MNPGLLIAAFSAGLLGVVHCVAMCGGIVGAYSISVKKVVAAPSLLAQLTFNGGRIASYAFAGALAGSVGGAGVSLGGMLPVQTMLFVVANGLLILLGLQLAGQGSAVLYLERMGASVWPLIRGLARRSPDSGGMLGRLMAGALWGWTPCGLVYSMLALALVSGSALRGAAVMLAFGLGTLPNLLAAGWLAQRFGQRLKQRALRTAAGAGIAIFGIVGLVRVPNLAQHIKEGLLCLGGA